jgi:cytochrome P450
MGTRRVSGVGAARTRMLVSPQIGIMDIQPLLENLDPHDPRFGEDGSLEAVMAELREHCPVAHTTAHGGAYVVSRYQDVLQVAQDWQTFTSTQGIMVPRVDNAVAMIPGDYDLPLQRHYRRALNPLLTREVVEKYVPGLRAVARELLGDVEGHGQVDIVSAFTDPYPRLAFFRHVLGVPAEEMPEVLDYLFAIKEPKSAEAAAQAWADFTAYMTMMCDRRKREQPRGDLLDGVLHAKIEDRPITRDEAVRALMQLTFGGLGTTSAALANIIRRLAEQPELQRRLRSDRSLLPRAIEELLRFDTITIVLARTTTRGAEIEGTRVPEGEKVLMYFAGANRDPREFDDPDAIDIDREVNRHLVFGAGPHRCLGSNLARRQILVALEEVLDHLDDIRLLPERELHFHSGFSRGLNSLTVTFTPVE